MNKTKILITGATGQVGGKTIEYLKSFNDVEIVAAVRSEAKAQHFKTQNISSVIFDYDDESTHANALQGIERLLIVTGYTVEMLRQSKVLIDNAKKAGVKHIVHLGACGRDDTSVGHWAWHQLIERYIEWSGFSFTHLRPETFMQNLLSYGGKSAINNGVINHFVENARLSWVDVDDVAQVASLSLANPKIHNGKTYRLGYDAKSFGDIAELMTKLIGKPFQYKALAPEVFLESMKASGAEMAYMGCVYEHWKKYIAGTIPGADDTFENFPEITGREPVRWAEFIEKHKDELIY